MKSIKTILAALVLAMPLALTSCEGSLDDVFGEWSRPVPSTVVEEAKVLGAALETGATVTINYTVGGINYVAVFKKESDDTYTLISNTTPSTARAMTRLPAIPAPTYNVPTGDATTAGSYIQLKLEGGKLVFTVIDAAHDAPILVAQMNVAGGEVTVINTNAGGLDCTIGSVTADDKTLDIKNPEMKSVKIKLDSNIEYPVKYSEGETWADVVERYKDIDLVEIATTTDGYISVKFSKNLVVSTLMATGSFSETEAETVYSNRFSYLFYLTSYDSSASTARGMTRAVGTHVKADDPVDPNMDYSLTTTAPGTTDD